MKKKLLIVLICFFQLCIGLFAEEIVLERYTEPYFSGLTKDTATGRYCFIFQVKTENGKNALGLYYLENSMWFDSTAEDCFTKVRASCMDVGKKMDSSVPKSYLDAYIKKYTAMIGLSSTYTFNYLQFVEGDEQNVPQVIYWCNLSLVN